MNNTTFYRFCKNRSNNEGKASKEIALSTTWDYLWEAYPTLPSCERIEVFLEEQIRFEQSAQVRDAFCWLLEMLNYDFVEEEVVRVHR